MVFRHKGLTMKRLIIYDDNNEVISNMECEVISKTKAEHTTNLVVKNSNGMKLSLNCKTANLELV